MQDDQLPIGPTGPRGGNQRLPVRSYAGPERRAPVVQGAQAISANVLDDGRREDSDEIDLLAYWRLLVKRRWLILGIVSAVVAVALMRTLLTPPTYRATAVLQIDNDTMQVMRVDGMSPRGGYDPDFNQTQYELLKSRALAERVAEDLHLVGSGIFAQLRPPSWFQRLKGLLSPAARAQAEAAAERPAAQPGAVDEKSEAAELARAARLVQGGVVVEPVRNSHLVRVHYDSLRPGFAAQVANAVADGFIASSLDRQFGASSYARTYLEDQLAQLKSRLEDSERELVAFAQRENIVPATDGKSLVGQNLTELNTALATAQAQRIRAESRWNEAKGASGAALPADMLSNSILRTLQQQRAQLQGQYQDKLQVFKPDYPDMLSLKGQIDEVQKQTVAELANIRASVKAEYDAAAAQERMLVAQLDTLRRQTLDVDSRSIQYNILKRDVDTNRQLYDGLLQRYKEVGIAGGVKSSNISVIDRAQVPGAPYAPSLSRNLMLGLLLGLMLGVMLALVLEYLDDTLKTPNDIEHHLRLSVLGIVPKLIKQQPRDALKDPRSAFSESYRSVRTALQFSTERGVPNVLLITSPNAGEGKSTSAVTLARNFAQLGKRVLLIEGDLRNPSLSRAMGLATSTGLSSLLAGAATLAQSVIKTDDPHLDVILAGPLPPSPTELLSGSKLVSLLMAGAEKYDQIIIDGPPVLGIADAPILANIAAGTLLIVQSGSTRIATAQAAIKRLRATRARMIGVLLTQYDAKAAGYGYNYEGEYSYGATPRLSTG